MSPCYGTKKDLCVCLIKPELDEHVERHEPSEPRSVLQIKMYSLLSELLPDDRKFQSFPRNAILASHRLNVFPRVDNVALLNPLLNRLR